MTTCRLCMMLRFFLLFAALILGAMIWFALSKDAPVTAHLPGPMAFAMIVPIIGIPGFIVKYRRWRREQDETRS